MDIVMINGSPKVSHSNTSYLLDELKTLLTSEHKITEFKIKNSGLNHELIEAVKSCNTMIIGFPLYVDGLPSHLLYMLEEIKLSLAKENHPNKITVYAIANCGFFEGIQTKVALQILKNWCKKVDFIWGQGIGIGAGEMLGSIKKIPLGHGPKKSIGKALQAFVKNIAAFNSDEDIYVSPDFPRIAFTLAAQSHWNTIAKNNGLKKKDINKNTL